MKVDYKDLSDYKCGYSPEFEYCKDLLNQGVDPKTKVEFFRGDRPGLIINSIEGGAKLKINHDRIIRGK